MEEVKDMRLLIISERFSPEPFLVGEIADYFATAGFNTTVITQVPSYPDDKIYPGFKNTVLSVERSHNLRVIRFATVLGYKKNIVMKILNYIWFMFAASLVLLGFGRKYDAVFVYHTGPLTQSLPLFLVQGAKGRRVLWTQDVWPDTVFEYGFRPVGTFAYLLKRFVRKVYARIDHLCITSPGFKSAVEPYCSSRTKVHYIPQWVPRELLKSSSGNTSLVIPTDKTKIFRFAGTIATMQNLESVIEGFLQAAEIDQTIILEIFGDGSERAHLENMLRRHGTTKVRFAGRIPMEKIMPLLEQAHALVLPLVGKGTVSKTIPAKLQAYLVAGRPIFAIMNGTVAKLVKENHLGQVADPSSISAIRDGFLSLASADPIELCSMGTTCREYVKKTFDRESTLESFLKMVL